MSKLCVIGDPIAHSKSPLLYGTMLKALGLDYVYHTQLVRREETAQWVAQAKAEGYAGFNATMPHKENLLSLVDELDEGAKRYGSVNTVCIKNEKLYGHSTDGQGFLASLAQEGIAVSGKRVVLLGAGGAAKAVALALAEQGAERITVCSRTAAKGDELCKHNDRLISAGFDPSTLTELAGECDLLVNGTSLGMAGTAGQFEDFSFVEALPPTAAVYDLIYAPAKTELLRRARLRGVPAVNGLGMLVWQAIFALEHFIGAKVDGAAMAALLKTVV